MELEKLTVEQFNEMIANAAVNSIEKYFAEKGFDEIDKKYFVDPQFESEMKKKTAYENFGAMLKALKEEDYGKLRVKAADPMVEGTPTSGGYLVPEVVANEILRLVGTYGQARSTFRNIPMPRTANQYKIPKKSTGVTFSHTAEAGAITSSKPTLELLTITAEKFAGIVPVANELLSDSVVDLVGYIIELFAESIGILEDTECFSGGSTFTGIFNTADVTGSNYGFKVGVDPANLTYDNIVDMVYGLDSKLLRNANWIAHRTVIAELRKIKDSNGNPIFVESNAGGLATLMGFPVKSVEAAPSVASLGDANDPYLLLGNTRQHSIFSPKKEVAIDMSKEATIDGTSLFQNDLSAIRVIERFGFNKGMVEAYSVAHTIA